MFSVKVTRVTKVPWNRPRMNKSPILFGINIRKQLAPIFLSRTRIDSKMSQDVAA